MLKLRTTQLQLLLLCISFVNVKIILGYSQIALSGSNGPKIYKAMNVDLIFPKTFNTSENVISTTDQTPTIMLPSTWPSNHKPAIFVTPAREDDFLLTTASPWLTSSATEPHVVAESYVLPSNQQKVEQTQQQDMQQQQLQQQQFQTQQELQEQQEQQQMYASTGRAVDYRATYPFGQLITPLINKAQPPRPGITSSNGGRQQLRPTVPLAQSGVGKLVYPSGYTRQRAPLRAQISDRFSPSEGVVSHQLKHQQHRPAASNQVSSYVPPKNIYSFPPNVNAKYPSPSEDPTASLPTNSVSSYLPPASGPLVNSGGYPTTNNGGYVYSGPINPDYMAPAAPLDTKKPEEDAKAAEPGSADNDDDTIGVLPASAMDGDAGAGAGDAMNADSMDMGGNPPDSSDPHDHDHDHSLTGYDTDKEYPTPPPGWLEEHPEAAKASPHDHEHDHEHIEYDDHHHDHFPSYPIYRHHYPEIIYDDHHYHHHPPPMLPPETTTAPPPEPLPEPRVKKYSYFYIGRKLWYIPLYFTVWFSFYVLWLIVKSIARHKVNLPNHYVTRRSLPDFSPQQTHEYINQLTVSVLQQIDKFKEKYLKS